MVLCRSRPLLFTISLVPIHSSFWFTFSFYKSSFLALESRMVSGSSNVLLHWLSMVWTRLISESLGPRYSVLLHVSGLPNVSFWKYVLSDMMTGLQMPCSIGRGVDLANAQVGVKSLSCPCEYCRLATFKLLHRKDRIPKSESHCKAEREKTECISSILLYFSKKPPTEASWSFSLPFLLVAEGGWSCSLTQVSGTPSCPQTPEPSASIPQVWSYRQEPPCSASFTFSQSI